jgi:citrate/tricarballylate utilization protein
MLPADLAARGAHTMTVCNACRYCEQYCAVFPAMEQRQAFGAADLTYLANLCHNCGECLYACQFAPPHEFGINVPRLLAETRLASYEEYCWPRFLATAFRRHNLRTGMALAAGCSAVLLGLALMTTGPVVWSPGGSGDFYAVVPHGVMVGLFGAVFAFALLAVAVGVFRFRRAVPGGATRPGLKATAEAVRSALTLRYLHDSGTDCTDAEETRRPWRRWLHHGTFYGFMLCFASTSVAAVYHGVFGWRAPYGYASLPVILGTLGGLGLVVGPAGLLMLRRRRDPALGDPAQRGLDESLLALLLLTSATGLALLALRHSAAMGVLLVVHLGAVLALFLTIPYGKFVHGLYRLAALVIFASGTSRS